MKNLFKNIWDAPAATAGSAFVAALGVIIVADIAAPKWLTLGLAAASAFLSLFSGPNSK
jgi:hypothetical protein